MVKLSKVKLAAAAAGLAFMIGIAGLAHAAGFFPFGNPQAVTGLETVPMDTNLPQGMNPATESLPLMTIIAGTNTTVNNATSFTISAANLAPSAQNTVLLTGAPSAAQTVTTPTAALLIAQLQTLTPSVTTGYVFMLRFVNVGGTSSGVWTVAGGTGVTVTGNATVAVANSRIYQGTLTSATAITLQDFGT